MTTSAKITLLFVLVSIVCFCSGCPDTPYIPEYKLTITEDDFNWTEISQCVNGVTISFSSGRTVRNAFIAKVVFDQFVFTKIYRGEGKWECCCIDSLAPYGTYLGVKYWRAFTTISIQDKCQSDVDCADTHYVSENGDVVTFDPCI